MKIGNDDFTVNITKRLIANVGEKDNNFAVVKHYNTYSITSEDAKTIMMAYPEFNTYFHTFSNREMVETYEPFLNIIKNVYTRYYHDVTLDEYLSEYDIYPLQKSFLKSYIESGMCMRDEDFILDEIGFEHKKMVESVANIIIKLSQRHKILIIIDNLHMAPQSTIELLLKLFEYDNKNIALFAAFNDLKSVLPHVDKVWNEYMDRLNGAGCIYDGDSGQMLVSDDDGVFNFSSRKVYEYLLKLRAMYYALDFEQAGYYLRIIYNKLEIEHINIDEQCKFDLYMLYGLVLIFSNDIPNSLIICDELKKINSIHPTAERNYNYHYIYGLTQVYGGNLEKAKKCADICNVIAENEEDEYLQFKAELLSLMVEMSGWHNIFFFTRDTKVSEGFVEKAEKYGYYNHLAYIYIYAFDNSVDLFKNLKNIEDIDDRILSFSEGIDLAKNIGNTMLVTKGYRKNIMLTSANGLFEVTNYFYNKLQEVIGEDDPLQLADIYNGLGYNNCTMEHFKKANDNYNKALDIYMEMNRMKYVGETLYNMAINCMQADKYEDAYDYLRTCVRIINVLKLNNLQVCNISKIFGLLALCAYRLDLGYKCILFLDTNKQFLTHILNNEKSVREKVRIDKSFNGNNDELFLYRYVSGLVFLRERAYKQADECFKLADENNQLSNGNQFFSMTQLKISHAEVLRYLGKRDEAQKALEEAYNYAKKHKYRYQLSKIKAAMSNTDYEKFNGTLKTKNYTIDQINEGIHQAGVLKDYDNLKNQMEFISIWQNILDTEGKTKNSLISTAANAFMLSFSIDLFVFIHFENGKPVVYFNNSKIHLSEGDLDILSMYFQKNRNGFATSKIMKNYKDYNRVLSIFDMDNICSMVCNPFFVSENLDSIFISCIYMKENWNIHVNRYLLDETELNMFNLLFRQLLNAIHRIESVDKIRQINHKLQKSSVTDYLTGLNNRDGFYGKVEKLINITREKNEKLALAILYIDLDNFKYYNDTFGHDVGDLILKEIAGVLKDIAGNNGFATRYGGDEFLITLINSNKQNALVTAKLALDTILAKNAYVSQISRFLGRQVVIPREKAVSCSIGISFSDNVKDDEELAKIIKQADEMLYSIKHTTKGDVRLYEK